MIIKLMKIVEKSTIEIKVAIIDQMAMAVGVETLKWLVSPMLAMAKIRTFSTARDTAITNEQQINTCKYPETNIIEHIDQIHDTVSVLAWPFSIDQLTRCIIMHSIISRLAEIIAHDELVISSIVKKID
jgi:hypothetical protein